MLAALGDAGEGGGCVLQLEDRVDLRSQLAGVSTPGELEQLFAIRLHDEVARALGLLDDGHDARPRADGRRERLTANGVEYELARLLLARQLATRKLYCQMAHPAACPRTRTRSPSPSWPWSKRPCQALSPGSGSAALSTCVSVRGRGASALAGIAA